MSRNISIVTPASDPAPFQIETFDPELNDICGALTAKECLTTAKRFERWAAGIRAALGYSGYGPTSHPSCAIAANYYLNIGFSKSQMRRLKQAASVLLNRKHRSSFNAAWHLLNVALANLEIMERLSASDHAKCRADGGFLKHQEFSWENGARAALQAAN